MDGGDGLVLRDGNSWLRLLLDDWLGIEIRGVELSRDGVDVLPLLLFLVNFHHDFADLWIELEVEVDVSLLLIGEMRMDRDISKKEDVLLIEELEEIDLLSLKNLLLLFVHHQRLLQLLDGLGIPHLSSVLGGEHRLVDLRVGNLGDQLHDSGVLRELGVFHGGKPSPSIRLEEGLVSEFHGHRGSPFVGRLDCFLGIVLNDRFLNGLNHYN